MLSNSDYTYSTYNGYYVTTSHLPEKKKSLKN